MYYLFMIAMVPSHTCGFVTMTEKERTNTGHSYQALPPMADERDQHLDVPKDDSDHICCHLCTEQSAAGCPLEFQASPRVNVQCMSFDERFLLGWIGSKSSQPSAESVLLCFF